MSSRGETRDRRETIHLTFHGEPKTAVMGALVETLAALMREAGVSKLSAEWIGEKPPWKLHDARR
jgi:hypothetical protein